jgi:predicted esterase
MLVVLCCGALMAATDRIAPGDHALTFQSTVDGSVQPYRLFVPRAASGGKPLPLVVVLHGKGADHNTWFDVTPIKEHAERHDTIVAAPEGRGDDVYRGPGEQDVLDVIQNVCRHCAVDPDRVYLIGHSMGGWGTWWIGLRHPDRFAAICPMAAMAPIELLPNARHLAPFAIHDAGDDVVPVDHSRRAASELNRLGILFQYREETGYGHSSKLIGDNLDRIFSWLEQHPRVTRPQRITYVTKAPECGQAYWIRVLEAARPTGPARVEATAEAPHRLVVKTSGVRQLAVDLNSVPIDLDKPIDVCIDGQTLTVPQRTGLALFVRESADGDWRYEPGADAHSGTGRPDPVGGTNDKP